MNTTQDKAIKMFLVTNTAV